MKRSLLVSAIVMGVYYLVKQLFEKDAEQPLTSAPRKKHLTRAFSKAKEHALAATE